MRPSSSQQKKVALSDTNHEVLFTLSTQSQPHLLNVYCKQIETSSQYWGQFQLADLQPHFQVIFQKIQNLFHYISQKTEEVEIISSNSIKIQFNFLKQSRELNLTLSQMVMCSAQDQKKQQQRIKNLESQNETLKNKIQGDGGNGYNKFTIPLSFDTCNVVSYVIANFCGIMPIINNYLLNLIKSTTKTQLPKTGLWYFHIQVTSFAKEHNGTIFPLIEIGVKSQEHEKSIITLRSNLSPYIFSPQQQPKSEDFLRQNDFLRLIFNMDIKQLVIEKNFRVHKSLSWKHLKGTTIWPYLRFFMVSAKTDLFIEQENIAWGFAETMTPEN